MANGTILSFKLLIHYLLTLFPTAVAAWSKLACLPHIRRLGRRCISHGRTKTRHKWLWQAEAQQSRGMKGQLASSNFASVVQVPFTQQDKTPYCFVFSPAKAQSSYKLLVIFFHSGLFLLLAVDPQSAFKIISVRLTLTQSVALPRVCNDLDTSDLLRPLMPATSFPLALFSSVFS